MEKKNSVSAEHLAKREVSNEIIQDAAHRAEPKPSSRSRRRFMGTVTAGVVALPPLLASITGEARAQEVEPLSDIGPVSGKKRERQAFNLRVARAQAEKDLALADHSTNGDEDRYANRIGNYSKGLPHNSLGEVNLSAYDSYIKALSSGKPADFEAITLGLGRKLTNPQAGLAFELQCPDSHCLTQPPAPAFASAEEASEIAENYWMALLRDVPFLQYATDPLAAKAAADLSKFSDFRGPKVGGAVTPDTLFRGNAPGTLVGPYISQFMWLDTFFGAEEIDRQMRTTHAGVDHLTSYDEWLAIQNGGPAGAAQFESIPRYIRNGRDLGQWVHIDVLFQAYFNALLIMAGLGAPPDSGNPYKTSHTQIGFGTLGDPYIAGIVCSVPKPALKAVWYEKWFVHRRLRPEEFAGRIHNHVTHATTYPIHSDILNSEALTEVHNQFGTYLLPMAFPEGCPTHPAYGAGHATVAGACVTVLKAFFDESFVIPDPVVPTDDGLSLTDYNGPALTLGGELNKLAYNVANGRNIAGVHWRTDATESIKLGEEVAIRYLREEKASFNEDFGGFSLTKFDGTTITV
jgi:hypothetical protein